MFNQLLAIVIVCLVFGKFAFSSKILFDFIQKYFSAGDAYFAVSKQVFL